MTASPGPLKPFTRRELIESHWQPSERRAYGQRSARGLFALQQLFE